MAHRGRLGRENHFYKDGYFGGWQEFRQGPRSGKKITLPRVFKGEKRKHVVSSVMDEMRDWRSTPFQKEGDMRAAIRSALCLQGEKWIVADYEAEQVTKEALALLGAKRPTWEEGQANIADNRDQCSWCRGVIDGDDRTPKQRYCSSLCARRALEYRKAEGVLEADASAKAARRVIRQASLVPRDCQGCGKTFRRERATQRFCSFECGQANKIVKPYEAKSYERVCMECSVTFIAAFPVAKFCCVAHQAKFFRWKNRPSERRQLDLEVLSCKCCGTSFTPKKYSAIYCSSRCASIMGRRAYNARKRAERKNVGNVIYLTMEDFDRMFARKSVSVENASSAMEAFDRLFG